MAAGEGTRLRPLTERWPKPILPVDGRPVVVTLLHELAFCERIVVVTGHLAEQVEELVLPLPYPIEVVRQPPGLGSADAVQRARARPPYLVLAADTVFEPGAVERFAEAAAASDGAIGWSDDRRAPIWFLGERLHARLDPLPGKPPYELQDVFGLATDDGATVSAIQVGGTRGLTSPADVVRENFPYLR
ncbi:MAG TPA: NTP transferase domain-containing protein [Gaiellaceae bacterium]|nr:NTP transferase domain-containing protein [Gaiellaceae bacterium]